MNARLKLAHLATFLQPLFGGLVFLSITAGWPAIWVSWLVFLCPSIIVWRFHRPIFIRTPFDIPLCILGAGILIGLVITPDMTVSLDYLQAFIACTLIYYMIAANGMRFRRYWLFATFALSLAVVSIAVVTFSQEGTATRILPYNRWLYDAAGLLSLHVNYEFGVNVLGTVMGVSIPWLVAFVLFHQRRFGRILSGTLAGAGALLLVMSGSTDGLVAAVAGCLLCLLVWRPWTLAITLPLAVGTPIVLWLIGQLPLSVSWLLPIRTLEGRFGIWERSLQLLDGRFLMGLGPGTWYEQYAAIGPVPTANPHNDLLQVISDSGALGALAALAFIVFVVLTIRRIWRVKSAGIWYTLGVASTASIVAFAVGGTFETFYTGLLVKTPQSHGTLIYQCLPVPLYWILTGLLSVASLRISKGISGTIYTETDTIGLSGEGVNLFRLYNQVKNHPVWLTVRRFITTGLFIDICAGVLISGLLTWKIGQVLQSTMSPPLHGEWWGVHSFSDYLTLLGARRFVEEGFIANYFSANITVGFPEFARGWVYYQVPQTVQNSAMFYTHYGSLDTIVSGVLMSLGVQSLTHFYLIFSVMSFTSLSLWYVTSSLLFGRVAGCISTAVIGTSIMFLSVAETNSAESLVLQLSLIMVFFFILAKRVLCHPVARMAAYAATWFTGFLQALNNPQFLLFIVAFIGGYLWIYESRTRKSVYLFIGLCSSMVIGMVVHLALNAWVLGGIGNMLIDLNAAVLRRTSGFDIAVEVGYREFQISQSFAYLENVMWNFMHLEFFGIAALAILARWMIGRLNPSEANSELRRQWVLAMFMLAGGLSFVLIFIQATVTQPMDILKVALPGTGTLIGMNAVLAARYIRLPTEPLPYKSAFAVLLAVILLPYGQHLASGASFSNRYQQGAYYQGGSPEQVRALSTFIKENTKYGDVVLTNIHTGDTGHNLYPHPAWEYLSDRRIDVFNTIDQVNNSLRQLLAKRDSLAANNPAKQVSFYILVSTWQADSVLGELCRKAGVKTADFESHSWWLSRAGTDPYPRDRRSYDLYKIDTGLWLTVMDSMRTDRSVPPERTTPWSRIVTAKDTKDEVSSTLWWLPRFSHIRDRGSILFSSSPALTVNVHLPEATFNNRVGTTAETRIRILETPSLSRDSAMFSLLDGTSELKISFTGGIISVFDRNRILATHPLPQDKLYHTYRLNIVDDTGRAYLDGQLIASSRMTQKIRDSTVLFGDFAPVEGESFTAEFDYVSYTAFGAYAPNGRRVTPEFESGDLQAWGIDPQKAILWPTALPEPGVPWTRVFNVGTSVASQSLPEWKASQPSHAFIISGNKLAVASFGIGGSNLMYTDDSLKNITGTTLEVGMWLPRTALADPDSAILAIQDGHHEFKLSFFETRIDVLDQNIKRATIPISASSAYHVYRLALAGDSAWVYVDGVLAASVNLSSEVLSRRFLLGNFSTSEGLSSAVIDYVAYSNRGAFSPGGKRQTGI